MSADRVEVQVLERARARALVSDEQLATAQAAHEAALAQGQASNLLVHLANRLDPATRAGVRQIYLEAVEAAREGASVQTTAFDSVQTLPLAPVAETQAEASLPTAATSAGPLAIPGYTLGPELGRGGMGVVYRATSSAGQAVAIKVLLAGEGASTEDLARFRTEAEAVERLEHPHVVSLLEHGQVAGNPYMVLEFVDGEDLEARLDREERLPPEEAVDIAIELADALSCAHEQGILHRDLKPQNVLLDREGLPKLTDFGLAKLRGDDAPSFSLTQSGTLLGTPAYMAPEQADGDRRRIDERTDVYGLGATLYHMLTGRRPFSAPTLPALFVKILNAPPPRPRALVPELDPDLETIVLKCLEKDGADRYPSAQQLLLDLSRWRKDLAILAAPPSLVVRARRAARRNPALPFAAGFAVLVLVLAAVGLRSLRAQAELEAKLANLQRAEPVSDGDAPPPADDPPPTPADPTEAVEPPEPRDPDPVLDAPADPEEPTVPEGAPADPEVEPTPEGAPAPEESDPAEPDPSVALDDPPPADDPPPPSDPPSGIPAAEPPPAWLVRRVRRYSTSRAALPYAVSWQEGGTEAHELNVPLIVVAFGEHAEDLPAEFAELASRGVLVMAQIKHPGSGRGGDPCSRHPGYLCSQHTATVLPVLKDLGPLGDREVKLLIYRVTREPAPFEPFAELVGVGGGTGSDFRLVPQEAAAILRRAQSLMGEPLAPPDTLATIQPHLYALSELGNNPVSPSERILAGARTAGPALMKHVRDPDPVGGWARWCVRELVDSALAKSVADNAPQRRQQLTVRNLTWVFGGEPGCRQAIMEFARAHGLRVPRR